MSEIIATEGGKRTLRYRFMGGQEPRAVRIAPPKPAHYTEQGLANDIAEYVGFRERVRNLIADASKPFTDVSDEELLFVMGLIIERRAVPQRVNTEAD